MRRLPASRRVVVDAGRAARSRHSIHGLLTVDVTAAHRVLTGAEGAPTLTGWVVWCVAQAAAEHPEVHAGRDLRNRLVVFEGVDVNVSVETSFQGRSFPMNHVLRSVHDRTPADLSGELHAIKRDPGASPTMAMAGRARIYLRLPGFVRSGLLRLLHRLPAVQRRLAGTIGVTSVGMFGEGEGWGIAFQMHTLDVVVGGMSVRPGFGEDGGLEPRRCLHLTLSFDHDVVDGAPAARFAARLRELMETAAGM